MITNVDWINPILASNDPQDAFTLLHTTICKYHNICFPLQKIKLGYKTRKPWLTQELKNMIKIKNKLCYKSKTNPDMESTYKKFRNSVNKKLHKAERSHFHELLLKKWKYPFKIMESNQRSY